MVDEDEQSPDVPGRPLGKNRRVRLIALSCAALLVGSGVVVVLQTEAGFWKASPNSSDRSTDSDGDALEDWVETRGWSTGGSRLFRTDPQRADSDGDGLTDGQEAGPGVSPPRGQSPAVYRGYSDPTSPDSDGDGVDDASEAESCLDPRSADTDGDALVDGKEIENVGTSPVLVDTDKDGVSDGDEWQNRESRGLDPLAPDSKVSAEDYARDFIAGAGGGELTRVDSVAWLVGNLSAGASSSVPVIGTVIGAIADLRDAVGSAIRGDWVGSGMSLVGVVPVVEAVANVSKIRRFVRANPQLAGLVAQAMARLPLSDRWRVKAITVAQPAASSLKREGMSDATIVRLAKSRTDFTLLVGARKRAGYRDGRGSRFVRTARNARGAMLKSIKATDRIATFVLKDLASTCGAPAVRVVDACVGGTGPDCEQGTTHEARVGYQSLTPEVERQIRADGALLRSGRVSAAHWHFYASAVTNKIGASGPLLDRLDEEGIAYTIHVPA
jgi:hypothetical protein